MCTYPPGTSQLFAIKVELVLYVEMLVEKIFAKERSLSTAIRKVNTAGQPNINNFKMGPSADAASTVTKRRYKKDG